MDRLEKAKDHGIDWRRATLKRNWKHYCSNTTPGVDYGENVQSICCIIAQTPTTFSKLMEMGGRVGGSEKGGGCCLEMGVAMLYWGFFWRFFMIQHKNKILMSLSFLCAKCATNCLNTIWDDWHCDSFTSLDSYNSCINYSCK